MNLINYSDKSFVITGNTKEYKDDLKEMGGKWNSKLTCGSGWVFSLTKRKDVENWIREKNENCTPNSIPKEISLPKNIDIIFNNFVKYLEPFYGSKKKLQEILYDFSHSDRNNISELKNDVSDLYNHFYVFFKTQHVTHEEYQNIDKDKFIEHALIKLM